MVFLGGALVCLWIWKSRVSNGNKSKNILSELAVTSSHTVFSSENEGQPSGSWCGLNDSANSL